MTVSSSTNRVSYAGNGSTTVFPYTYKIFDEDDLTVIVRAANGTELVKTITSDYTVSGVGSAGGGNVTMLTAPATGETLVILREQDLVQELDIVPNDPFPADSLEGALDKLTFMVQQQQDALNRSIKASRTNTISSTEFTISAANRANKIFAFDSAGDLSITQELGTNRGNWAASTAYNQRDIVKDGGNDNLYFCNTSHTSSGSLPISTNTDAAKWDLLLDVSAFTTLYDQFDDRYLGAKNSDPATDNDGNTLIDGALYWNTTDNRLKVYDLGNTTWVFTAPTSTEQTAINAVAAIAADVSAVAAIDSDVTAVAADATDIGTVASNIADVNTVANDISDVTAVAGDIADVSTVAGDIADVSTVAGISSDVTTVAGISADVTAVAGDATDIGTVAGISANVTTVAGISSDVTTVAGISANVTTVAGISSDVTTVAANVADVTNFADVYVGPSATDPTTRTDSSALQAGDLYFNTATDQMKIYDGATWQPVAVVTSDFLQVNNNLSDLDNAATARTNLGLGSSATENVGVIAAGLFTKADPSDVAWTKTGNGTAETQTVIYAEVNGSVLTVASGTSITMPTLTAGTDYAIWLETDGDLVATTDHTSPPTANARKIGGFHYAPGGNATGTSGGNTTAQINEYSFWDLNFRPSCPDPRGMTLVGGGFWVDIYLTGVDAITNGSSKYNVTMADGSSPPKVPTMFGGDGSTTYGSYTWFEAQELATAFGKRTLTQLEFMSAAYGTTEASSVGSDQVSTVLNDAYTSKWGVIQAAGVLWVWGRDRGGPAAAASWNANTEGRGSEYNAPNAVRFGGNWSDGSVSGSRCSVWNVAASNSSGGVGSRFACDHLQLG